MKFSSPAHSAPGASPYTTMSSQSPKSDLLKTYSSKTHANTPLAVRSTSLDYGHSTGTDNDFMKQLQAKKEVRVMVSKAEKMISDSPTDENTVTTALGMLNSCLQIDSSCLQARASIGKARKLLAKMKHDIQLARKAELMRAHFGDNWQEAAMLDLKDADEEQLRAVFNRIDVDGSGALDRSEITDLAMFFQEEPMTEEQLDKAMAEMDEDGSGEVEFDEFLSWWGKKMSATADSLTTVSSDPTAADAVIRQAEGQFVLDFARFKKDPKFELKLRGLFNRYDDDGSGDIDPSELADIMKKFGRPLKAEELEELMAEVAPSSDITISFEAFRRLVLGDNTDDDRASSPSRLKQELRQCIISGLTAEQYAEWAQVSGRQECLCTPRESDIVGYEGKDTC